MKPIPVIDIFAGPGGLGEGFCSLDSGREFDIRLSIEKDPHAHRTLELRAFYRRFSGQPPPEYYQYLAGKTTREDLFKRYPVQAAAAATHAWQAELGSRKTPRAKVDERIALALGTERRRWVLIGGPPCQAYSVIGRSRMRGSATSETEEDRKRIEEFEADKRHYLYRHYLSILAVHQPLVFVMENVKGLLSARVREQRIVENLIRDLTEPGSTDGGGLDRDSPKARYVLYSLVHGKANGSDHGTPEEFVVKSEDYGVPQMRHRVILLGVRADVHAVPNTLRRHSARYCIEDAIGDLPPLRSRLSREPDSEPAWLSVIKSAPNAPWFDESALDPGVRAGIRKSVAGLGAGITPGSEYMAGEPSPAIWPRWYRDPELKGFCNHTARAHMRTDLARYLFVAVFGATHDRSPNLEDFPTGLLPDHDNVSDALLGEKFNDRFRVQLVGRPSTTITSHLSKDGHYFIHYDPAQCRSLTVREAARLQTFPDNYFFEGPRTEQYKQVGNAVPPFLAKQIAEIVAAVFGVANG